KSIPDGMILRGRNNRPLVGAACLLGARTGHYEWSVWVHKDDRWVCGLHFHTMKSIGKADLIQEEENGTTVALRLNSPAVRWVWSSERETFGVPASLPAPLIGLSPLPDQAIPDSSSK